jgi:hypothetical protein
LALALRPVCGLPAALWDRSNITNPLATMRKRR